MSAINSELFTEALRMLLDEVFDHVNGYILDKGDSMFETLAGISAEQASIPIGDNCATLAAQVKHTAFYLDATIAYVTTPGYSADWNEVWRTVGAVTPEQWATIKDELRASYDRILGLIATTPEWTSAQMIGTAIAVVAHSAYHLGQIRQSLCVLRA